MKASVVVFFIIGIVACTITKKAAPSPIGVVSLSNYELTETTAYPDEINYAIITDVRKFRSMFSMTKASFGKATIPDFGSQSVVAIILKPTEKVVTVDIDKATLSGINLNIYYSITDTTSWKNYAHIPKTVATVPKALHVSQVNFYRNNVREKTLPVTY